jgi:hypothetical protein
MNCAFFSVLSTSLSIAANLAQGLTLERITATSSGGAPREPMIPVSVSRHYGESFVADRYTLRCNDGGNLFVRHVALYGAASFPTNWR